jgi:hypothetical protein
VNWPIEIGIYKLGQCWSPGQMELNFYFGTTAKNGQSPKLSQKLYKNTNTNNLLQIETDKNYRIYHAIMHFLAFLLIERH